MSGSPTPTSRRAPLLVLALILLLSTAAALVISGFVRAQQQSRFEREVQAYSLALRDRLNDYDRLLRTARATWLVHPDLLNEAVFARFVDATDLARRYPGVQALGFGPWVPDGDTTALVQRLRRSVRPDYALREGPAPQRARVPISVIAPASTNNLEALGFDLYSEPLRRTALDRARQQDDVQATARISLVQRDERGELLTGFLLMLPVWENGRPSGSAGPQGFIYMAVRADQFLKSLDQPLLPGLGVRALLGGELLSAQALPENVAFRDRINLTLAGQPWTLEYSAGRQFGQDAAAAVPVLTMLAGLLIAGLAYLLVQSQVSARGRAEALNVSLAQARLRQEQARAEFEAIFQSMQDAAVFTDVQGRVRLVNRALTRQFGFPADELIGQPLSSLHVDDRLGDQTTITALTTPYRRRDGSTFSGEVQRSEVQDASGEHLGSLEVVRDVTAQIAAQRALQAGERRYRGVLDAIPHILQVSDPQGRVTYVNAQHQALLGHDELAARLWPEDLPVFDRMWREARVRGGEAMGGAHAELRLTVGEGVWRWFMLRVAPRLDETGAVREWVTSATDIHDRLLAEQLAQRSEERYRSVLESLPQIVWLTDPQGTPFYFNRRWDEYVGSQRAAAGFLGQLHPDDRAAYQQRWAAAIRSARPFEAEHRLLSAHGTYRSFVTRGLPVLDAAGQVIEWVGTSTDVDDSVYEENAARLLADVSQDLGTRGPGGQPLRTALGRLTARFVDSAAVWSVAATPEPAGEAAAAQVQLLTTSSLHPAWKTEHMRAFLDGAVDQVVTSEDPLFLPSHPLLHGVRATGALFYPLLDRSGRLCGVLGLFYRQAMTARDQDLAHELAKRFASALEADALQVQVLRAQHDLQALNQSLEERVRRRTEELEGANRELEAFSYSVSHDLRTPLRHIVGFGDLLGKELGVGLSSKGQRYLGIITDSASRMSQLIDDLLDFSRMGRQELRRELVDLRALLQTSWTSLEPDRQGRQIDLTLPDHLPTVRGDPALLGLAFTNLLSNAVKYTRMRERGEITVSAETDANEVTVTVRDNGVGFDPRYVDKLFGVFQRLHRADEFEGIGIGLANVRRIVTRHGGRVRADARPDEGASFTVTLPLNGHPSDSPTQASAASAGQP